jgi:hypothetical protein
MLSTGPHPRRILHQIGRFNLPSFAVADVDYPHYLPLFFDFIDHPINVRLLAVKQLPQLSLRVSRFRSNRAAQGNEASPYTASSSPLYQRAAACDSAAFFSL